jgi:hypothetical protein
LLGVLPRKGGGGSRRRLGGGREIIVRRFTDGQIDAGLHMEGKQVASGAGAVRDHGGAELLTTVNHVLTIVDIVQT